MRLCLSIEIQEGMSYAETLAMTRAGEELGFEASLLAEHYYPSGGADRYAGRASASAIAADAWIYLAALARETSRIRLGTLVSPVTFRHPSVLAKMAATLDHVERRPRRAGHRRRLARARAQRVRLRLSRRRAAGRPGRRAAPGHHRPVEPGSVQPRRARRTSCSDCHFTPKPVQQPRPTILVGGRTTAERLPRLAGQVRRRVRHQHAVDRAVPRGARAARPRVRGQRPRPGHAAAVGVPGDLRRLRPNARSSSTSRPTRRPTRSTCACSTTATNWIIGTPDQAKAQLDALAAAGIDRALISVNCDLHREMLPLLVGRGRWR